MFAQAQSEWERNGPQQVADCKAQEAQAQQTDPTVVFGCDDQAPQREWFVPAPTPVGDAARGVLLGLTFLLGFLALTAGATFTAAEVSTRSLTTWLTFEPRRLRVMASKLAATGLGIVLPASALIAAAGAGTIAAYSLAGADTAMTGAEITTLVHTGLRLFGLAVLLAVVASALGLLLKHTAAVLGLAIGYLMLVENILPALLPRTQPWLLMANVVAWVQGGATYSLQECTTSTTGTDCTSSTIP